MAKGSVRPIQRLKWACSILAIGGAVALRVGRRALTVVVVGRSIWVLVVVRPVGYGWQDRMCMQRQIVHYKARLNVIFDAPTSAV